MFAGREKKFTSGPAVFMNQWLCYDLFFSIDQIILPPDYPSTAPPIYQIK